MYFCSDGPGIIDQPVSSSENDAIAYCSSGSSCAYTLPDGFITAAEVYNIEGSYVQVHNSHPFHGSFSRNDRLLAVWILRKCRCLPKMMAGSLTSDTQMVLSVLLVAMALVL